MSKKITARDQLIKTMRTKYENPLKQIEDVLGVVLGQPQREERIALLDVVLRFWLLPYEGSKNSAKPALTEKQMERAADQLDKLHKEGRVDICGIFHKNLPTIEVAADICRQLELLGEFGRPAQTVFLYAVLKSEHVPYMDTDLAKFGTADVDILAQVLNKDLELFAELTFVVSKYDDNAAAVVGWLSEKLRVCEDETLRRALLAYALSKSSKTRTQLIGAVVMPMPGKGGPFPFPQNPFGAN